MNNQKDTQKTGLNSYGQNNVLNVKPLGNKSVYEFANKKTEKLVTALYMVTDCMDTDEALKIKIRQLGVELLSDMYKLSSLTPQDKHSHIYSSLARIDEIVSFLQIAYTIGFVSEMNTSILKKEFRILVVDLEAHLNKDKHFTFTLDEQMFSLPVLAENNSVSQKGSASNPVIKDKTTNSNNMSFMNSKFHLPIYQTQKTKNSSDIVSDKKERSEKILSIIKDRGSDIAGEEGVSIKDISKILTNCSEKTVQRELNSLVSKGQVKKTGSKRWSKYIAVK